MTKLTKRKILLHTNRYQKKMLLLFMVPVLGVCIFVSVLQSIFIRELIDVILFKSSADIIRIIYKSNTFIFFMLWAFFFLVLIWSLTVSEQLLGAFERIVREMDGIIEGNGKKVIRARKGDELPNELLKRINVFIKEYKKDEE